MMKIAFALLAIAGAAMAQNLNDLDPCGQTCVNNMLQIAQSQFGCSPGDAVCYCTNPNFGFGIRDCVNEACSPDQAARVIAFGTEFCRNALASSSALESATTATSNGPATTTVATTTAASETTGASETSSATSSATSATTSGAEAATSITTSVASPATTATASPTGAAPLVTAFPLAGAAGMAAFLFL